MENLILLGEMNTLRYYIEAITTKLSNDSKKQHPFYPFSPLWSCTCIGAWFYFGKIYW